MTVVDRDSIIHLRRSSYTNRPLRCVWFATNDIIARYYGHEKNSENDIERRHICRVSLYTIRLLLVSHAIPCQTCKCAAGDREKGWYVEVKASHKCACGHNRPKGIRSE
jgi:hypothetical protein